MKHVLALIVFIPITTIKITVIILEMFWRILHVFHYRQWQEFNPDEIPGFNGLMPRLEGRPAAMFGCKLAFFLAMPVGIAVSRLSEINDYEF